MSRLRQFLQRACAYGVDFVLIGLYALALWGVVQALVPEPPSSKLAGYAIAVVTLTGPAILIFSLLEAGWGATPGKALMGLRVRRQGARPGLGRALVRNLGKFLPWEIAHIGIWTIPGQPFVDPPGLVNVTLWTVSYGLLALQIGLVLIFRAGFHDWMAGLRVQPKTQA